MKTVGDILGTHPSRDVYSIVPDQSILSAAQFMRSKNIGAVAVLQNHTIVGVLSERDMLKKVLGPGSDPRDVFVGQIMSQDVTTVSLDETWDGCLTKMRRTHCRHLPVVEKGELFGMISLRDLLGVEDEEMLDTYLWDRDNRNGKTTRN